MVASLPTDATDKHGFLGMMFFYHGPAPYALHADAADWCGYKKTAHWAVFGGVEVGYSEVGGLVRRRY